MTSFPFVHGTYVLTDYDRFVCKSAIIASTGTAAGVYRYNCLIRTDFIIICLSHATAYREFQLTCVRYKMKLLKFNVINASLTAAYRALIMDKTLKICKKNGLQLSGDSTSSQESRRLL